MQPKFEWLLNGVALVIVVAVGGLLVFLSQFALGAILMGLVFYGGIGFLMISLWKNRR